MWDKNVRNEKFNNLKKPKDFIGYTTCSCLQIKKAKMVGREPCVWDLAETDKGCTYGWHAMQLGPFPILLLLCC